MAEALLNRLLAVQPLEPEGREGERAISKMIGFVMLAFYSAMAVSSWHGGFGAVSFLVFYFVDLGLLFHCLRMYARTPPASPRREVLKMAACLLATMLTITSFKLLELWFLIMGKTDNPTGFS